jgi:leader peptidase (prepilin peptidase)/N-methyltransferase
MAGLGVLGLAAGSVVNVLVERVPDKQPLLPLRLSWPTTRRALGVHLLTAALFAAAAARFGASWVLPAYLFFFASLVAVSAIDLEHHIIPNRIVYPTIFVSVPLLAAAGALTGDWHRFGQALLGATWPGWLCLASTWSRPPAWVSVTSASPSCWVWSSAGWVCPRC